MKCDEIKTLLDEYLDGTLPEDIRETVKKHVQACPECKEELRFLKQYMKSVKTIATVKAPDDFLEELHRRINAPARTGIIQKLFVPVKIKVPLEAAAVAALAVTGMLLFRPFATEIAEQKSGEPASRTAHLEEKDWREKSLARREKPSIHAADKDRTVVEEAESTADVKVATATRDDSLKKREASRGEQMEITLFLKQNTVSMAPPEMQDSVMSREKADTEQRKGLSSAKKEKPAAERIMGSAPAGKSQASTGSIAELAQSLDGRVIKKVVDEKTKADRQVVVEIPSRNYGQFMKGLSDMGEIQKQSKTDVPRQKGNIQIRMNIQN